MFFHSVETLKHFKKNRPSHAREKVIVAVAALPGAAVTPSSPSKQGGETARPAEGLLPGPARPHAPTAILALAPETAPHRHILAPRTADGVRQTPPTL